MKKILLWVATSLVFWCLGILVFLFLHFRVSLPKEKGEIVLPGLTAEVRVVRDGWGIPHVFAPNDDDLFYAVGFVHAQERMWQMELLRRAGVGRLSEIFGRATLEQDKFLRHLGLRQAVLKDYENLSEEMKEALTAYSEGINAWLRSRRLNWPPEFMLLRFRPEPWRIEDCLAIKQVMALILCADYASELVRARLVDKVGFERGLEILEKDVGAVSPEEVILPVSAGSLALPGQGGSNNWVVAGSRTESGFPLLANDPHLELSLPSIWFELHLHSPGFNVVGVTFPGVPLVVIGHNDFIAWGVTNSGADVQDLYVEKINEAGDSFLDPDGLKPLRKVEEWIRVRGEKNPVREEVQWTSRGPILPKAPGREGVPLALRWTIHEGGRIFESIFLLNKARNWSEFCRALALWDAPSQNVVFADIEGNIGYYLTGRIPLRKRSVALFPAAGWRAENQWQGYMEEDKKPNVLNPASGYIVTANHKIVSDDFPYYISSDFDVPFRADRIEELILRQDRHTVDSFARIQNDVLSRRAELFLPFLRRLQPDEEKARQALAILRGWNGEMRAGPEAALFAVFMDILEEEVFEDELGEVSQDFRRLFRRKGAGLFRLLNAPDSAWYDNTKTDGREGRDDIFSVALKKAVEWLEKNQGSPEKWDWARLHAVRFDHALGRVIFFRFFNRGPFPLDGDSFTVRASFGHDRSGKFATSHGVSYRQIIDLGDFRNSVGVLSSGQSGHFLSRHYDNQIPLWLRGEYRPILFDRDEVEANASTVLFLKPSRESKGKAGGKLREGD